MSTYIEGYMIACNMLIAFDISVRMIAHHVSPQTPPLSVLQLRALKSFKHLNISPNISDIYHKCIRILV
jgi:hypothetical protein